MEIRVADNSGFCFGVKRAVSMAVKAAEQGRVYSLGPLIHNPRETERLSPLVCVVDNLAGLPVDERENNVPRIVIRSHGVGPEIYEQAQQMGVEVIDATCPFVAKVQKAAKELYLDGYQVVIVGDHDH
ncbi:MAG: bifunctional 4-hydroxy-3-methylbut-2-enyl diphosphate reductase/30S ribosomal protein S1, partial [Firmicutes bacterium]|nr:bifunctional 4-hydroxy-3-methylbut-2-enyl diphosphate reductase/30S ribosomal protein S1 [Bacillota bacterium]